MDIQKKFALLKTTALCFPLCALLLSACGGPVVSSLKEEEMFSLEYGSFEDELNVFDYNRIGSIRNSLAMRDGFFYIANRESQKIMELNSYGDLLTLFYNEDSNPRPSFAMEEGQNSTRKAVSYPFNEISSVTVDSRKFVYAVDKLPVERQEVDEERNETLSQIVLRFDGSGNFVDYLGQEGPGGTPFPFVKQIYVTEANELVVVCTTTKGPIIYWFSQNGHTLFTVPIETKNVPVPYAQNQDCYVEIENVVPDYSQRKLYMKADYYLPHVDEASRMMSGIDYDRTMLYTLNVEDGSYEAPLSILPYTEQEQGTFSNEQIEIPYDFLGVSDTGWFFFVISTESGFQIQMVQENGQRILNRTLRLDHHNTLYYTFSLSNAGIISILSMTQEQATVNWWGTDSLIQTVIKG